MEAIHEFTPPGLAKECWCSKCKKHRPDAGSVEYVDGHGRRKRACSTCRKYVKAQGMALAPQPIGNLVDDAIRSLSDRIKLRALNSRAAVQVYVDPSRDVFAIPTNASTTLPDDQLIATYTRKALLGEIAEDLMHVRNGR